MGVASAQKTLKHIQLLECTGVRVLKRFTAWSTTERLEVQTTLPLLPGRSNSMPVRNNRPFKAIFSDPK
eukprot:4593286-Pyramimonas_sp.AAC.1